MMTTNTALRTCLLLAATSLLGLANASEPHPQETAAIQHVQAADAAMKNREFAKAVTELEQAVNLVPEFAEYHLKLSNAYVASKQLQPAWLSLRKAATLNPSNREISNLFSRFFNMFDQRGTFNVGQPVESVVKLLGKPDKRLVADGRERLIYGFHAVEAKAGRVHELLDLRGLKLQHMTPTEIVVVDFDGRDWHVDYRVNNQLVSTAEYVLQDEKIQNWSELVNIQRLHGQATTGLSLKQVVEGMMTTLKKSNPDRQYRILEQDENSILFEWKTGGNKNSVAQHELVRLFYGPRDMHRLAYVKKCPELASTDRDTWLNILKSAKLKSIQSRASTDKQTAKSNQAKDSDPAAVTRQLVWKLGGRLSGAAVIHSTGVSADRAQATFEQARATAKQLGVDLAPLPELVGDHIKDSLACSTYLLKEMGPKLHRHLTANYDRSHVALLEIAIKSNLLHLLYAPGDSTGKAIGRVLKDRAEDARLPEMMFQPLLSNIEKGAERKLIVYNTVKLHTDVQLLLKKRAQQDSEGPSDKLTNVTNQLQGVWKMVHSEGQEDFDLPKPGESVLLIEKNRVSFVEKDEETIQATFEIDATTSPMQIVWTYDAADGEEAERLTEIFKFEDDTVVFCGDSNDRIPTEFEVPAGSDRAMMIYKKLRG